MAYHSAADDPFMVAETKGDQLYEQISADMPSTDSWKALQGKVSAIEREANGGINRLPKYRQDLNIPLEGRVAQFDQDRTTTRAKVDGLHKDAQAILGVLKVELMAGAIPKMNSDREAFVRQDVAALLEGPDALKTMTNMVRGPNRDHAAAVLGEFGSVYLRKLLPAQSQRDRFHEALRVSALDGAIAHGTPQERKYAKAAKELAPKVEGWLVTRTVPALYKLRDAEATRP
jgi:hypothetical protein